MLAAITAPQMPALISAVEWVAACLLGALIGWALLVFFLRRRLGTLRTEHGPLFAATLAATFGAAALSLAGHALALRAPFVAAPAQMLFLIWFYLYPDFGYATTRIRWLCRTCPACWEPARHWATFRRWRRSLSASCRSSTAAPAGWHSRARARRHPRRCA